MGHLLDSILTGSVLLLAFIIFINPAKVNTRASAWFAAFMLCFFFVCLQNVLLFNGLLKETDKLFELLSISNFLIAPLFYLSAIFYITPLITWKAAGYLHFGFAAFMLLVTLVSFAIDVDGPAEVDTGTVKLTELVFNALFSLQVIFYCLLSLRSLVKYQRGLKQHRSALETIDLNWLKHISIGVMIMSIFWTADIMFSLSERFPLVDIFTSLVYLCGVFYIAGCWWKQREIFPYTIAERREIEMVTDQQEISPATRKSLITDEKLAELKAQLATILETEKPYLAADLNLIKLAGRLNVSAYILSYIINTGFNENFYQLINRYRVEEAARLMLDPKMAHLNLLGIGFEVGFNSKSVFNSTFKKVTGLTPSAYKSQYLGKKAS